ncbi:snare associated Golgi protein-domain-containing protein [Thamnocephalis sphaerospora]|uniref:Snare associated Golgi protein-domain-containing protein n=1 Tax=Thamnocephalis sphaerospora TaxID=78915 RepID=A0A4P9XSM8_9FUNG|nr:snare associated Golgi protein-domain-containing protein [Thamnocephalis sphaerospora]|eukprot:RKP08380.1 snare associated Golgi protein-domain-containing protein [Thamnocephalis sphaerospora]
MSASVPASTRRLLTSLALLVLAFCVFAGWLYAVFWVTLPHAKHGELPPELRLPRTLDELKALGRFLDQYTSLHFVRVSFAFISLYVFLQTFAIPGSIMLSVLGGALFGVPLGLFYVCAATALGATNCYWLSKYLAGPLIERYLGARMASWQRQLASQRKHLFNYILFLRVTPFLPNWFINLAAPHLDVPASTFFFGTFFGVAPPSFVHVQAGRMLPKLQDINHLLTLGNFFTLVLIGIVALLPIFISRCVKQVEEEAGEPADDADASDAESDKADTPLLLSVNTDDSRLLSAVMSRNSSSSNSSLSDRNLRSRAHTPSHTV